MIFSYFFYLVSCYLLPHTHLNLFKSKLIIFYPKSPSLEPSLMFLMPVSRKKKSYFHQLKTTVKYMQWRLDYILKPSSHYWALSLKSDLLVRKESIRGERGVRDGLAILRSDKPTSYKRAERSQTQYVSQSGFKGLF